MVLDVEGFGGAKGRIIDVVPDCFCISPAFDLKTISLSPGSNEKLKFQVQTGNLPGDRQYGVRVRCEFDGVEKAAFFTVGFYVRPTPWATPKELVLAGSPDSKRISNQVWVNLGRSVSDKKHVIDLAKSNIGDFQVKIVKSETLKDSFDANGVIDRWELDVSISTPTKTESNGSSVSIVLGGDAGKVDIPISTYVKPLLSAFPKAMFLGLHAGGDKCEKVISIENSTANEVTVSIKNDILLAQPVSVTIPALSTQKTNLLLTIPESAGRGESKLSIQGKSSNHDHIVIPISWVTS